MIGDNSAYRKYALFVRLCREEKAHTYDKWIYHQLCAAAQSASGH
jgi:hypothetical protein